jgi:hypothetical protein
MLITYILLTICCMICLTDLYFEYKKYERFKNNQEKRNQQDAARTKLKTK